ncbi:uncharacterized protein LOC126628943 [Malus sylvestris]|uniref:uncharacterized protein LOC126628943 n=1 Tax=Malus sylvestris TaxID=3752 RepID=UPI0021ACEE4A|nr:uncharacterized protein LOC126628943 [Malus sylvestris]
MWRDVFNYKAFWNGRDRKEKDFRRSANMLSTRPLRLASIILLASLPPSQSTSLNFFASYFSEKESLSGEPHMPVFVSSGEIEGETFMGQEAICKKCKCSLLAAN